MAQSTELSPAPAVVARRSETWRWTICWLMFASTVLNYMDRQVVALVGTQIKAEFSIRNESFGWVMAAFSLSYAFWQIPAGFLVDRWNTRWTYAGAVTCWSLAGVASAFSPSLGVLMVFRGLLGVGESFNWPCALRVTGTILPPADRSLGNGIFNSGAAVGAVLTPLIVPPLANHFGWRTAFLGIGCLGFGWVAIWLMFVKPEQGRRMSGRAEPEPVGIADGDASSVLGLSAAPRAAFGLVVVLSLAVGFCFRWFGLPAIWWAITVLMVGPLVAARLLPPDSMSGTSWTRSLGEVVRMPRFWILVVVSISINICWHFLINWLPTYLKEDRGMTYLASGMLSALPFLAADVGSLGGGAASRFLAIRGLGPARARVAVMAICLVLIHCGAWVGVIRSNVLTIVLLGAMALGTAAYMANFFAFCQDVSSRHTGFIVGILGGLGNLCVAGFLPFAGKVKDITGSFSLIFVIVGLAPFVGLGTLAWGWSRTADPCGEPATGNQLGV